MPGKVEKSAISINFFETSAFDYQLLRAVGLHYQGGSSIGECLATASRIKDGDVTSWVRKG
ncbi:MAG: hypothetical protein ABFC12_05285 [Methanobacterium sp.]